MGKVVIGKRPKSIKHTVTFPDVGGDDELTIPLQYKYRTRSEYGAFIDKVMAAAEAATKAEMDAAAKQSAIEDGGIDAPVSDDEVKETVKKFSMKELMEKTSESNADFILDIIDSWDLDVKLTREAVQELCDERPAGAVAIMSDYRLLCTEGRVKN